MPSTTQQQAWWTYPSDSPGGSYGQITDPLGPYLKPDVNFAVPAGIPITSLVNGVVTDVSDHGRCCGGLSVVVAMSTPLNSVATHVAYNFLGSASVRVGQSVSLGQQVGIAGSPYGIDFALALTSDNVWGDGTFYLNAQGNPALDPHQLITGRLNAGVGLLQGTGSGGVFGPAFVSVSNATYEILNNVPGFAGICLAVDAAETFVPFKLVSSGGQDVGILGKIPVVGGIISGAAGVATLPSDAIQAILTFITANTMAALIRLVIMVVGIVILLTLVHNAIEHFGESDTGHTFQDVAGLAAMSMRP